MRECLVQRKAGRVFRLSQDLAIAMRQLKREFRRCQTCDSARTCWVWEQFHIQVDRAIEAVNREWGLRD
jgi:hypothetical protein